MIKPLAIYPFSKSPASQLIFRARHHRHGPARNSRQLYSVARLLVCTILDVVDRTCCHLPKPDRRPSSHVSTAFCGIGRRCGLAILTHITCRSPYGVSASIYFASAFNTMDKVLPCTYIKCLLAALLTFLCQRCLSTIVYAHLQ
jgi:hypothetical protein